jgi:hypothetical protein
MKIAHRGRTIFVPENTLRVLKKEIELGAEYVEIDARYSDDNLPDSKAQQFIDSSALSTRNATNIQS